MALVKRIDPKHEAFMREWCVPAEWLPRYVSASGGYRYFQALNVHPIENYHLAGRAPAPIGVGAVLPFRRK